MAKKKTTKKKVAKKAAATKSAPTKTEIFATIAADTDLTKKQVAAVFDSLGGVIKKSLSSRGAGMFALPGLCKMTVKKKPATKARPGRNPFTGESITIKAKPASKIVRIRPLKALKDML
jgi:nucleoid DNA-binding protein